MALQPLFDMIRRYKLGSDVELHKRTLQQALLSLVGPRARGSPAPRTPGAEHANAPREIDGVAVLLVATDVGVDLICAAEDPTRVRGRARAGAAPVAEAAAEVLRVEAAARATALDLDDTTIPQEAGLNERAVCFTKGCYVGQETVARLHYKGKPNRHLRGLRLSAPAATGTELRLGERGSAGVGTASCPRAPARSRWRSCAARPARRRLDAGEATRGRRRAALRRVVLRERGRRRSRLQHHRGRASRRWRPSLARPRSSGRRLSLLGPYRHQTRQTCTCADRGAACARTAACLLPSMRQ